MKDYTVVTASDVASLRERVLQMATEGFKVKGGVSVAIGPSVPVLFAQAMVK